MNRSVADLEAEVRDLATKLGERVALSQKLKADLKLERMAREDADRRFSESAMAHSAANVRIERLETDLLAAQHLTCDDARMARTIRELEVLTIEAARQLRDRITAAKLNLDYELKVAFALLDRQLVELEAMRTERVAATKK